MDLRQSERAGTDDGRSATAGLIPVLQRLSGATHGVGRTYLCSAVDHHAATYGDRGWGCGYRNLQMLLSSLVKNPEYASLLAPHQVFFYKSVPKIANTRSRPNTTS